MNALASTVIFNVPDQIGSVIGPYKLLQQIGEGGFGVVYMAEQEQPVRRLVALKIIKPGMDTSQVVARFESERQALALMDHPNIARVLDAGATDSGHPYFVMELVKGVPITEFCDKNRLTPEVRLKLFMDVCHAIQHAHHKGIIHRDIKPSNVLVTRQDGLAGRQGNRLRCRQGDSAEVDREDVVYRLRPDARHAAVYEPGASGDMLPRRRHPQRRLLAGRAALRTVDWNNAARGQAVESRGIFGDAAADPRGRSAATKRATVFVGGRGHGSRGQPRPRREAPDAALGRRPRLGADEGAGKRSQPPLRNTRKFRGRHRPLFAARGDPGPAAFPGLPAEEVCPSKPRGRADDGRRSRGIVGRYGGFHLAGAASDCAESAALIAARTEKEAKDDALVREAETNAVLDFVENRILAAARPEGQDRGLGRTVTLRKAIESALPFVHGSFRNQPLIEARLRLTLGQSFYYLDDVRKAAEQEETARALYTRYRGKDDRNTLLSMSRLAGSYDALGRLDDALKLGEETFALRLAKLGPDHSDTVASMQNLANSYHALGRNAERLGSAKRPWQPKRPCSAPTIPPRLGPCITSLSFT